jgi:hypothetical protein
MPSKTTKTRENRRSSKELKPLNDQMEDKIAQVRSLEKEIYARKERSESWQEIFEEILKFLEVGTLSIQ